MRELREEGREGERGEKERLTDTQSHFMLIKILLIQIYYIPHFINEHSRINRLKYTFKISELEGNRDKFEPILA